MAGKNPYLDPEPVEKPAKDYELSFPELPKSIQVEAAKVPYSETGLEGSILEIALAHGIDIEHSCGGVAACSTCHVIVKKGLESCNEASDAELDQLEKAPATTFQSRLACQTVPNGSCKVEVSIPKWNRNLAREGKH